MNTLAARMTILSGLFALAACGGGGDSNESASAGGAQPGPAPAPAPAPAPPPAPAPAPAPASTANTQICGTPITGNPGGGGTECQTDGGKRGDRGSVKPAVGICLGTSNCQFVAATVRIDTAPTYAGPLTGKLVVCERDPGEVVPPNLPQCTDPSRNDSGHYGFLDFKWDLPNGNAGPSTTLTYQVLTSTRSPTCDISTSSDVTHLRIDDESGNTLFIAMKVAGSCGF